MFLTQSLQCAFVVPTTLPVDNNLFLTSRSAGVSRLKQAGLQSVQASHDQTRIQLFALLLTKYRYKILSGVAPIPLFAAASLSLLQRSTSGIIIVLTLFLTLLRSSCT